MNIERRLKSIEDKVKGEVIARSDAKERLAERLTNVAERLRGTPLSEVTENASPIEIAALALDGRVDKTVANKVVEYSRLDTPVGSLFKSLLEVAG